MSVEIPKLKGRLRLHTKGIGEHPTYNGPTRLTPKAYDEQELLTKDCLVKSNIIVESIPTWETSNLEGGYTFFIGEM